MFDLGVHVLEPRVKFVFVDELDQFLSGRKDCVKAYIRLRQPDNMRDEMQPNFESFYDLGETYRCLKKNLEIHYGEYAVAISFSGKNLLAKEASLRSVLRVNISRGGGGLYNFFLYQGQKIKCK